MNSSSLLNYKKNEENKFTTINIQKNCAWMQSITCKWPHSFVLYGNEKPFRRFRSHDGRHLITTDIWWNSAGVFRVLYSEIFNRNMCSFVSYHWILIQIGANIANATVRNRFLPPFHLTKFLYNFPFHANCKSPHTAKN